VRHPSIQPYFALTVGRGKFFSPIAPRHLPFVHRPQGGLYLNLNLYRTQGVASAWLWAWLVLGSRGSSFIRTRYVSRALVSLNGWLGTEGCRPLPVAIPSVLHSSPLNSVHRDTSRTLPIFDAPSHQPPHTQTHKWSTWKPRTPNELDTCIFDCSSRLKIQAIGPFTMSIIGTPGQRFSYGSTCASLFKLKHQKSLTSDSPAVFPSSSITADRVFPPLLFFPFPSLDSETVS